MPNWCYNTIEFNGEQKNLEILNKLLLKTEEIGNITHHGQILHGLEQVIDGYMFSISNININEGCLIFNFDSRWNPIPNDIIRIAELFNLTFIYDYEESGNMLHGKYTFEYEDGVGNLYEQTLSDSEINSCYEEEEDEDTIINYEKMESLLLHSEMNCQPITRINEKIPNDFLIQQ